MVKEVILEVEIKCPQGGKCVGKENCKKERFGKPCAITVLEIWELEQERYY
jgi:hypothetical protein